MKKLLLIIAFSLFSLSTYSKNVTQIMEVLKVVESNNKVNAIGDNGKAFGILQIHKVCVDDINRFYGTDYTHEDAFDISCSEEMFHLYINMGISRYKKRNGVEPSEKRTVQFWNFGIYQKPYDNGYYKKYKKSKKNLAD